MQVALFTVSPGDQQALEELNRFLRGHRVLTLDRQCLDGVWSFCVTYQPALGGDSSGSGGKVDYRAVLDERTFVLFSRLRETRKKLAEQENLPPYAVFTNEQLAEMVQKRVTTKAGLDSLAGVGKARVDKYGDDFLKVLSSEFGGNAS